MGVIGLDAIRSYPTRARYQPVAGASGRILRNMARLAARFTTQKPDAVAGPRRQVCLVMSAMGR